MKTNKKGFGSFCIPRAAAKMLLKTGEQAIPAFLKMAAHTDKTGCYSTAGLTSIKNILSRLADCSGAGARMFLYLYIAEHTFNNSGGASK